MNKSKSVDQIIDTLSKIIVTYMNSELYKEKNKETES